ncbi:hydrogenase maturation nickel metallochaperone HypA [Rhabdochromatium marinum]|uniref:hydrogenase maturation nickel metallochaperone HypA/HybF n=1 Tax=Rhabdochromatium marinum TaxID=48729 RepID=UPI001904500A|nr:hydrogenase maturation nickel metallochaperone HypA [Rhabdochromatium marinum]MBK1647935.1 hydrogenase nickel incorporation protein HypA [Rhabdochromatium marinum]
MHELSICLSLLDQVQAIAAEHQAQGVTLIRLRIGPLSGVEPQLLANAYPLAAAGTLAEHARLEIDSGRIEVRCRDCGATSEASPNQLLCAHCGSYQTQLISGDELLLASLELDIDTDAAAADVSSSGN